MKIKICPMTEQLICIPSTDREERVLSMAVITGAEIRVAVDRPVLVVSNDAPKAGSVLLSDGD
jgi:hypothetical protein